MTPEEALQDVANTIQFLVATRDQLVKAVSMTHQSMLFRLEGLGELSKIVAANKEREAKEKQEKEKAKKEAEKKDGNGNG